MRTGAQIRKEIDWFIKNKDRIPRTTSCGDNNWDKIDKVIETLEGDFGADDVEDPDNNYALYEEVESVEAWINGDIDDPPSKGWKGLVGVVPQSLSAFGLNKIAKKARRNGRS